MHNTSFIHHHTTTSSSPKPHPPTTTTTTTSTSTATTPPSPRLLRRCWLTAAGREVVRQVLLDEFFAVVHQGAHYLW
jgi:hypothetical protein